MPPTDPDPLAPPVDLLAIAAHRDDVELLCGGTMARAAEQGHRTGILDLTRGELGTAGDADLRGAEAEEAARVLGVSARRNAGLPDAGLENTPETRLRVAAFVRAFRPGSSSCRTGRGGTRTTASPRSSATTPASWRGSGSCRSGASRTAR
jgi:hypothetical protein